MKRLAAITLSSLFSVVLFVTQGCQPSSVQQAGASRVFEIGMSQCNLREPWRVQMDADIREAARKHDNLQVIFKDAQNDTLKQRSHVEEFVSRGVDLIIISPKESQPLTAPVAQAMKAGIPVIVLDRAVLGNDYTCFIGGDNKMIGRAAGTWLKEKLGGKGRVVELKGLMTSSPGQDRHSGFREAIAGSAIEVVFEADMGWDESRARKEMESALAVHEVIDAVYAHNDPAAHGAVLAAQAAGRKSEMIFIGIDALPSEGRPYVAQGIIDATFYYPTCGEQAIETALKVLAGEQVAQQIILPTRLFTKDNIDRGGEEVME